VGQARRLGDLAARLGLCSGQGNGVIRAHESSGGAVHRVDIDPRPAMNEEDVVWCYLGADRTAVALARTFDCRDHARFGRLMGYPECCISFANLRFRSGCSDLIFHVQAPRSGRYDALVNVACNCFGARLISHFPCAWDCGASRDMAARSLAALRRCDQALAADMIDCLHRDLLYSRCLVVAAFGPLHVGRTLDLGDARHRVFSELDIDAVEVTEQGIAARHEKEALRVEGPVVFLPFRSQGSAVPGDAA
jgi:hypothetical protein